MQANTTTGSGRSLPHDVLEVLRKRAVLEAVRAAYVLAHVDDEDEAATRIALKDIRTAMGDEDAMASPDPGRATLARLAAAEVDWVAGKDGYSIGTTHEELDDLENKIETQRQLIVLSDQVSAMTVVTLTGEQLEMLQREAMKYAALDLRGLADQLDRLATGAPWPIGTLHEDIHNARACVNESLGTLDALGWPTGEA